MWLFLAWAFVGAARHHNHWQSYPTHDVALIVLSDRETPVALRCRIDSGPESSPLVAHDPLSTIPVGVQSTFYADVTAIRNGRKWEQASGRVAVRVDGHLLHCRVGDAVEIFGTLSSFPAPKNPGESDRRNSERNRRTLCRLRVPHPDCVRTLQFHSDTSIASWIGSLRVGGLQLMDQFVGEPQAALAGALLLGARDRLDRERVERFFHTGTIHLLAISGLHVGILSWGFFFLANRSQSRRMILVVLMLGTILYCHLTGLRAPVMRASVLVFVVCISQFWRREFSALNALAAAAILILLHRPGAIVLPGAQLSFLAVGTLVWLSGDRHLVKVDPFEKIILESESLWRRCFRQVSQWLMQLALASGAIWVATLPLVMFWFHLCSPVSLILNVILSIPIAVGLLSGFAVLLSGAFITPVASICGIVCRNCLKIVEAIVEFSHSLPGAFFWVSDTNVVWCSMFYLGLLGLYLTPTVRFSKRIALAWLFLWLAVPISAQWAQNALTGIAARWVAPSLMKPEMRCTFLSVGHGTCVVIEMPDDRVIVYDAGKMGLPAFGVNVVSEFLWSRRLSHIDAILVSHADADHYNLIPGLASRFSVGEVFTTARMWHHPGPGVSALRARIDDAKIPIRFLEADDRVCFAGATVDVLHPLTRGVPGSDNANSIVLEVSFQGRRLLLPGDLESPGLEDVLAEMPRDVDIVMAPHHGSMRSLPHDFAQWCTPEYVVISAGDTGRVAAATTAFEQKSAKVFQTARHGAVTVTISQDAFQVRNFVELATPVAFPEPVEP